MSWSVERWKGQAGKQLRGVGEWMGRRTPYAVYGALCGLSLWPLVEAAQGEGLLPVMMALGSVAGGVGGNLIAERVQRWVDRGDKRDAVEWVIEQAPQDDELRGALDEVLERLDAVGAAQAGLGEADRRRLDEALRDEMARLGNLPRFEAQLTGSGAIAQGTGTMAVGAGGTIVEGDVHGDAVSGSRHTVFDMRGQQVKRQINVAGDWAGDEPVEDDGGRCGRGSGDQGS